MKPHRIRLRGPWQVQRAGSAAETVTLPAAWEDLFGDFAGVATFTRRFHRPTNLAEDTRLEIVFEGVTGEMSANLNGSELLEVSTDDSELLPRRFPITVKLEPMNELAVSIRYDPSTGENPGGLWGLVVLGIFDG